jgi:hypothetical protein
MSDDRLLLASRQCDQCLLSKGRVVSGERAAQIIRDCRSADTHFVCHKGSIAGLTVHCRGYHDRFGSRAHRFAVAVGIPVEEVDPNSLED